LILTSEGPRTGHDEAYYRRAVDRGLLIRLRPGAFCEVAQWESLDSRARHLLRMRAAQAFSRQPMVFAGTSAAVALGMPILRIPQELEVVTQKANGGRSKAGIRRIPMITAGLETVQIDGLSATSIAATAVQIALSVPFSESIGSVDWARWHRNPDRVELAALDAELVRRAPRYLASRL
jgi:hypothetical protein